MGMVLAFCFLYYPTSPRPIQRTDTTHSFLSTDISLFGVEYSESLYKPKNQHIT